MSKHQALGACDGAAGRPCQGAGASHCLLIKPLSGNQPLDPPPTHLHICCELVPDALHRLVILTLDGIDQVILAGGIEHGA